jgi:hypothetical protein
MTLEKALQIVLAWDDVAEASIWIPDADESRWLIADGITPKPLLQVSVWQSHANPSEVRNDVECLGLECVGVGSSVLGPCFEFIPETEIN